MTGKNYYASESIGTNIECRTGNDLGKVEDMVVSPMGQVEYLIVSYGGIFGTSLNSKLVAVPYKRFAWSEAKQCLIVDMSKEDMENAPNFDKDNIPQLGSGYYSDAERYHARPSGSYAA